jgi:hypothetical protein
MYRLIKIKICCETILISFFHIANAEWNITRKTWQAVRRNTQFTDAIVTFKLGHAKQLK